MSQLYYDPHRYRAVGVGYYTSAFAPYSSFDNPPAYHPQPRLEIVDQRTPRYGNSYNNNNNNNNLALTSFRPTYMASGYELRELQDKPEGVHAIYLEAASDRGPSRSRDKKKKGFYSGWGDGKYKYYVERRRIR